jgi:hypothetical protein
MTKRDRSFAPVGDYFIDMATNRSMCLVTEGPWEGWIVYRNAASGWVSLRKATADDREKISAAKTARSAADAVKESWIVYKPRKSVYKPRKSAAKRPGSGVAEMTKQRPVGNPGPWTVEGRPMGRSMVEDVARVIKRETAAALAGELRAKRRLYARDIAEALNGLHEWGVVKSCDRRVDRALALLKRWGAVSYRRRYGWEWILQDDPS